MAPHGTASWGVILELLSPTKQSILYSFILARPPFAYTRQDEQIVFRIIGVLFNIERISASSGLVCGVFVAIIDFLLVVWMPE